MPVICGEHTTHSELTIKGATPISAGFFTLDKGIKVYGESESLKLKNGGDRDERLIAGVLSGMGTSYFLDYDSF